MNPHNALSRNMALNHGDGVMMEMTLVLKVINPHCLACKRKLNEVLQCTKGRYTSFTMDGESHSHRVKITGRVDPGALMQVLSRSDGHGEVDFIKLNYFGESSYENYYRHDHHYMTNYGNPYNHQPQDDPYVYNGYYQAALPTDPGYNYQYPSSRCLCNIM